MPDIDFIRLAPIWGLVLTVHTVMPVPVLDVFIVCPLLEYIWKMTSPRTAPVTVLASAQLYNQPNQNIYILALLCLCLWVPLPRSPTTLYQPEPESIQ